MASFSFGFGGDDIEDDSVSVPAAEASAPAPEPETPQSAATASAFPVPGKPQLPPTAHDLQDMLSKLPSKVAFGTLDVTLDDGSLIKIPRRELWDVRVQLMAEDEAAGDGADAEGLGSHDVKTGVYEGGFKSWESSVDLVKVLANGQYLDLLKQRPLRVIEVRASEHLTRVLYFIFILILILSGKLKANSPMRSLDAAQGSHRSLSCNGP